MEYLKYSGVKLELALMVHKKGIFRRKPYYVLFVAILQSSGDRQLEFLLSAKKFVEEYVIQNSLHVDEYRVSFAPLRFGEKIYIFNEHGMSTFY